MSQPANTEIPLYLQRKLGGLCTRCGIPAATDADLCTPHLEDRRRRSKIANRARRKALRKKRCCIDCGRKAKKRRCPRCFKRSRGVSKAKKGESKSAGIWRADPGTDWQRYRGKARRGRLTREEQIAEDARDARFAIEELEKFIAALGQLARPEVMALPAIQREAAKRQVSQYLGSAGRFLDDLLDKYGG